MKYYAIIVGGGSGSRMKSDLPKQFHLLNDRPVIMHTLEAFAHSEFQPELILVLNIEFHEYWENLCRDYAFNIQHSLVRGGINRFQSVKNGLRAANGSSVIAIHDAVRPLASPQLISHTFRHAEKYGSAVPVVSSRDSLRQGDYENSKNLNREGIFLVQTPQTFKSDLLKRAYKQDFRNEFTDDASVVDSSGASVRLIEGEYTNIKITYPEDLQLAQVYLK